MDIYLLSAETKSRNSCSDERENKDVHLNVTTQWIRLKVDVEFYILFIHLYLYLSRYIHIYFFMNVYNVLFIQLLMDGFLICKYNNHNIKKNYTYHQQNVHREHNATFSL